MIFPLLSVGEKVPVCSEIYWSEACFETKTIKKKLPAEALQELPNNVKNHPQAAEESPAEVPQESPTSRITHKEPENHPQKHSQR